MEERTAREKGEEKRNGRLVGAAETSKELAEWPRLQRKNLSILGLLKRKVSSVPQREQLASTPELPLPKEKEQRHLSKASPYEGGRESRWARAAPWREREHEEERVNSTAKEGR